MTIAAALLSGCTGHREHHPQVTFTVDTVRTDTTASNPICLAEKYGSLLNERHPDLFAGAQGSISRSAFFNDSLTLTPETLHGMIQNTPCVAYSALFDHGLASKSDQRFASIRSTGNLTFSTAF